MQIHPSHSTVHHPGSRDDIAVPFTQVALTNGDTFDRYATAGPGSDPEVGLPALRRTWIVERGDVEGYEGRRPQLLDDGKGAVRRGASSSEWNGAKIRPVRGKDGKKVTQMHYARQGIITPEMEFVAIREQLPVELVRSEVAERLGATAH